MNRIVVKLIALMLLVPVTFIVSAVSSPSEYYEDAAIRLANDDPKGAIIQLKNAIKASPNMLSAHVLLGKTYLQEGELGNAQSELETANKLGADSSVTVESLAKTYLGQAKYQLLLKNISDNELSGTVQSNVLVSRGLALLELGQLKQANESFSKALFVNASNSSAMSAKALLQLRTGKIERAEKTIVSALKLEKDNADVWNVKASISHTKSQLNQAIEEYTKVLALEEQHLDARLARAGLYLDINQNELARKDIDYLRKEFTGDPRSAYLDSIIYKRESKPEKAKIALKESADILRSIEPKIINNSRTLHMLAGLAFYDVKDYEQAKVYLTGFVTKYPNVLGARKILGSIYFEEEKYQKTIDTLGSALVESSNDVAAISLLSAAYLRNGQAELGTQLLEKTVQAGQDGAALRTDLAIGYIELGEQGKGIKELDAIYKKTPNQRVGAMLALMHHKQGQSKKALTIAKELVKNEPNNLGMLHLLGTIQASLGQLDDAKKQFLTMAKLQGGKVPSGLNLAKIDRVQGKVSDARKRYQKVLKEEPSNVIALAEFARLEGAEGNNQQQIRWLEKVRSLQAKDWQVRVQLANLYREQSQFKKAQEAALDAKKIAPANLLVLQTVANVYIAAGKRDDAKYVYGQMRGIALDQSNASALYAIAERQASMSLLRDSVETLSIALEYDPQSMVIRTRLAEMLLRTGKIELAGNLIEKILKDRPKQAVGQRLKGDLLVHKGKPEAAIKLYRQAVAMDNNGDNALALGLAYSRLGKTGKAVNVLTAVKHGGQVDQRIGVALAELHMQRGEFSNASKTLEELVSATPNQPLLLNNLANIYDLLGDKRALEVAKKAYDLAPKSADINDTYGWLLSKTGQAEKGLPFLREAHIRNSDNLEVRYHIADTLNKLGRSKEALKELTGVLNTQRPFPSKERAKDLKTQLE